MQYFVRGIGQVCLVYIKKNFNLYVPLIIYRTYPAPLKIFHHPIAFRDSQVNYLI